VPSNISKSRLRKAFNEGRRSATEPSAENPYDNEKLRQLWEDGRSLQRSGQIKTPIPPLERGETRAQRAPQNPPGTRRASLPPSRPPRNRPGFGDGGGRRPRGRGM
jgi:hypothetical protein